MASKSRAEIQAWKQQLVHQAEVKLQSLTTSANFKDYLKTMAKFHHYSLRNINLIYAQDPQATQVAGFKQWQKDFNRQVTKGAKAIRIAAPITKRLTSEQQRQLGTKRDQAIVGYRYLPVFDVRHTTGEQLPQTRDFIKTELGEHANVTPLYQAFKTYLNKTTDLTVTERPMTENQARGYFAPKTNEIVIDSQESDQGMRLKTLYHEYAHSQLHGLTSTFKDRPRGYQEAQAEAVAYVAMQNIGIDTGAYSLGYVATWAKDQTVIHQALSEIQQVSSKTIEISDNLVQRLQLEKSMGRPQNEELRQEIVPEFPVWKPEMGLAASGQIVQQKKDYWKGVFERSRGRGFEVKDLDNHTRITLTKSARTGVDWQLTQYDSNGPYGHTDIVGDLDQPKVQEKIISHLIYQSGYVVKYSDSAMDKSLNKTEEKYRPVSSLQEMNEGLIETPTVIEKIKPSQAPFVKEIASKAEFAQFYDYDEVGHEYSAYRTQEGDTFYEGGAEDYVEKDDLKDLLTRSLNENEITIENVVGPKLATKLTDKTQRFVNEHLTNDGLKQQVNGLKRLQKTVNSEQIVKVNNSLQLANREARRRGLNLGPVKAVQRKTISR
ncbi:LtrC [Lactiplantibacillus plantarum]|nr:LtrC [Lactiplantibacillus plantarum]MCT3220171.1 LtrC [Lactiplantibacillus plantarum]MCT3281495.1 LtrC [Lactiplantibacillus plantarum]